MNPILWLLIAGAGVAAVSELLKRRKSETLPNISDQDFIAAYKREFTGSNAMVMEERNIIAAHLGVSRQKLSPNHRFDMLSKYAGFFGEYEVGIGNLGDELMELYERAAMEESPSFPATVGQLIYARVKAREKMETRL